VCALESYEWCGELCFKRPYSIAFAHSHVGPTYIFPRTLSATVRMSSEPHAYDLPVSTK